MSKTSKASLPPQSMLHAIKQPDDYLDCYRYDTKVDVDQAANRAMDFPMWVTWLMKIGKIEYRF